MNLWDQGKYNSLITDLELDLVQTFSLFLPNSEDTKQQQFYTKLNQGKTREALQVLPNKTNTSVLDPDSRIAPSNEMVVDILLKKHPAQCTPTIDAVEEDRSTFEAYAITPDMIPVNVTAGTVCQVSHNSTEALGPVK